MLVDQHARERATSTSSGREHTPFCSVATRVSSRNAPPMMAHGGGGGKSGSWISAKSRPWRSSMNGYLGCGAPGGVAATDGAPIRPRDTRSTLLSSLISLVDM